MRSLSLLVCVLGSGVSALAQPAVSTPDPTATQPAVVRLGVVTDGEAPRTAPIADRFRQEIRTLLDGEFEVEETHVVADWTLPGVSAALDRLLSDPDVDVVLAAGILASDEACRLQDLPKPLIAPYVLDASIQECPLRQGSSGRPNLVYATYPPSFVSDIRTFHSMVPFERLAVVTSATRGGAAAVVPERIAAAGREVGVAITSVVAGPDGRATLDAIPPDVDAVYFTPLLRLDEEEIRRLAEGLIERGLPAFSGFSTRDVELGMLATNSPDTDVDRLARRTALNLQRILLGEPADSLPVTFARGEELTINMATARALGTYPPWSLLTDARLLNEVRQQVTRTLRLEQAVREAQAVNLDLRAVEQAVAAGAEEVRRARAPLLPRLDVLGQGLIIDEDRAAASFGSQPERSFLAAVELGQLIYSDDAWAAYEIQQRLQEARESERDRVALDVTLEAAAGYIDVLRAKTRERIARDNLRLTHENLERARMRAQVGVASPAEVYRWEAQLAADRQTVIFANAQRNKAEIQLNRVLDRPGEESFSTVEVGLEDPSLITADPRMSRYIDNPWIFRVFRAFHVDAAKDNSPELAALDARSGPRSGASRRRRGPSGSPFSACERAWDDGWRRAALARLTTAPIHLCLPGSRCPTATTGRSGSRPRCLSSPEASAQPGAPRPSWSSSGCAPSAPRWPTGSSSGCARPSTTPARPSPPSTWPGRAPTPLAAISSSSRTPTGAASCRSSTCSTPRTPPSLPRPPPPTPSTTSCST